MRRLAVLPALGAVSALGCLGPLVSDAVPSAKVFGSGEAAEQPAVEQDPAVIPNLPKFTQHIAYLRGYADGRRVWYWNIDGANASLIAPMFVVVSGTGTTSAQIGAPIIDVLPGEVGYTPWWRRTIVKTTASYQGEKIWSRAAIDEGVRLGILEPPAPTTDVVNCPVALEDMTFDLDEDHPGTGRTSLVWYRGKRAYWVQFSKLTSVPLTSRIMPSFPVYVLQRINSGTPLYEFATGVDLDGDQELNNSNNIFASDLPGPHYSPLWYVTFVRIAADVRSIDTSSATPELTAERDIINPNEEPASDRIRSVVELKDQLINCPIQETEGKL